MDEQTNTTPEQTSTNPELTAMAAKLDQDTTEGQSSVSVNLAGEHQAAETPPSSPVTPESTIPPVAPEQVTPTPVTPLPEQPKIKTKKTTNKSGSKIAIIAITLVLLAGAGGAGYWFYLGPGTPANEPVVTPDPEPEPEPEPQPQPEVDETAPTIVVNGLTNGQEVSDTLTIAFEAADETELATIELLIDGEVVESVTAGTSFSWDSTSVINGNHTIVVRATDATGNTNTSETIGVVVENIEPEPEPQPEPTEEPAEELPNTGPGDTPSALPKTGPS